MICVLDTESRRLVSLEAIKQSYHDNIADGLIDADTTYNEYLKMIFNPFLGFCVRVNSLQDIAIDYFGNACFWSDLDGDIDDLSDYRAATMEDITE